MRRSTSDPTYAAWHNMLQRCTNPNRVQWRDYGGRGIGVCDRWRSFDAFLADMGPKPKDATLEREDNDKGYEPGNCVWTTMVAQTRNMRRNRRVVVDGETLCLVDALAIRGMNMSTFYYRVTEAGMTDQQAIDTPVRAYNTK